MKKILFLTNIPAPYTVNFFERLGKKYDLTVLFERKQAKNRKNEWIKYQNDSFKAVYLAGRAFGDDLAFCPEAIKYLKIRSFDLIIVGNYSSPTGILAVCYLKIHRIPYFIHVDGGIIHKDNLLKFKLKKFLLSNASGYMSSGSKTDEYLIYYGAHPNICHHYPFTSIYKKDIVEKMMTREEKKLLRNKLYDRKFTDKEFIVISVGNIVYGKGFDILIKAAKYMLSNVQIYVIGGKETEELKQLIDELEINNIQFLPFMPYERLKRFLECADIFAFPTRSDVWGLVVNEAMAAGIPIITTDKCIAGMELITQYKNGYIMPVDSPKILADYVNKLVSNPDLLSQMSENSRKGILNYTLENMTLEYEKHIENFICR